MGKRAELTGGGLLRSQGGWAEVASMRRRHEPAAFDARILGSGAFVGTVLAEAEQKKNVERRRVAYEYAREVLATRIDQEILLRWDDHARDPENRPGEGV
jgi:hypothetical protein